MTDPERSSDEELIRAGPGWRAVRALRGLRRLRALHWAMVAVAVLGVGILTCIHQPADRYRYALHYRGSPPETPRMFTLLEQWSPRREIPLVSKRWGSILQPGSPVDEFTTRTLPADSSGTISGELDRARPFSLGGYRLFLPTLTTRFDTLHPLDGFSPGGGARVPRAVDGVTYLDYHFLDVATSASAFRVPLVWEVGTRDLQITIDFDPIPYTSFVDVPAHQKGWSQRMNRCGPNGPVVLYPGAPHTLRYETFALPAPRPGQPSPRAAPAAVLLIDETHGQVPRNERVTPEAWAALEKAAVYADELRVVHDPVARAVTVELTRAPSSKGFVGREQAVLVIATPSTDDRWFGLDCVRLAPARPGP